jgi:hypothetical protein
MIIIIYLIVKRCHYSCSSITCLHVNHCNHKHVHVNQSLKHMYMMTWFLNALLHTISDIYICH